MKSRRLLLGGLIVLLLLAWVVGTGQAQGPGTQDNALPPTEPQSMLGTAFTYQGQLKKDGSPYSGTCDFRFRLWDAESDGNQVGPTQTKTGVQVADGLFTIPDLDFGADAFTGDARWLEIAVKCAGDADYTTLTPRQALTAAPYALGLRPGAYVQGAIAGPPIPMPILAAHNTAASNLADGLWGMSDSPAGRGVYGTAPTYGVYGNATATNSPAYGVWGESRSTEGIGVFGRATATSGLTYGVYGQSASTEGTGVYGVATAIPSGSQVTHGVYGKAAATSGLAYGVYGESASTSGIGVYGKAAATEGYTYGVWGESWSTSGYGTVGYTYATTGPAYGVYGRSASDQARGVYGWASATSGTTYGVYGQSDSPSGTGVYGRTTATVGTTIGVYGLSLSTNGFGVFGFASAASGITYGVAGQSESTGGRGVNGYAGATTGVTYGVYGESRSSSGTGVAGFATAASGYTYGVHGESASTNGIGVYGCANAISGPTRGVSGTSASPSGTGVFGWAHATSGPNRGVWGSTQSPDGWAGYFDTLQGNGVYVSTPAGKTGLNVVGGTKNAVVRTNDGSRLLYTEEAAEIWFADYGFGKLQNGVAIVTIDPLFAQTVNLEEPYHVFVQVYGDASVYVTHRTPTGFEVRLRSGDPGVEFSYRIVARRLGYENQRLERAPWADSDPNLYPENRASWEAQRGGGQ